MADLLEIQQALVAVIRAMATTVTETPTEEWTLGLVQARTEVLQNYWRDFQMNHLGLIAASLETALDYDRARIYADIERTYIAMQSTLYDVQRRLTSPLPTGPTLDGTLRANLTTMEPGLGHARLPRINVPLFSGRREDWESFRDLFRALIHGDPRLSDVAKFFYLKTLVQGEAKAALETLTLTDGNYSSAWRLLQSRYEHRRLLVQDHLTALRALRPLREESSTGLRHLLDTLSRHRDQLQALERPVESWDDWFVSIATSCMDSSTRRAWEDELEKSNNSTFDLTAPVAESSRLDGALATYSRLTEFIQRRCNMISCVEASAATSRPNLASGAQPCNRSLRSLATRATVNQCGQCRGPHCTGH